MGNIGALYPAGRGGVNAGGLCYADGIPPWRRVAAKESGLGHAALSIRALKFRYPGVADWTVDVSALDLGPGEQMLLTGGSGRGKSTLLQLIAGLMDPTGGHVAVDGIEVHFLHGARRDHYRGQKIGMIFQTFNLLHGFSAVENVMIAMMF